MGQSLCYNLDINQFKTKGTRLMNKIRKLATFLITSILLSSCARSDTGKGYREISMDEAAIMMEEETNYIILDVRRADEFAEKHIPGAINVPNEAIGDTEIPDLPVKDQLILVYCRSGNRSKQAAKKLVALGYTNVVEFGGIIDWKGETVSGS